MWGCVNKARNSSMYIRIFVLSSKLYYGTFIQKYRISALQTVCFNFEYSTAFNLVDMTLSTSAHCFARFWSRSRVFHGGRFVCMYACTFYRTVYIRLIFFSIIDFVAKRKKDQKKAGNYCLILTHCGQHPGTFLTAISQWQYTSELMVGYAEQPLIITRFLDTKSFLSVQAFPYMKSIYHSGLFFRRFGNMTHTPWIGNLRFKLGKFAYRFRCLNTVYLLIKG